MLARLKYRLSKRRLASRSQRALSYDRQPTYKPRTACFAGKRRGGSLMGGIWLAAIIAILPAGLYAQFADPDPIDTTVVLSNPNFFVAIVAGLILAVAFQLVLTNLSLAAGLNILGPIDVRRNKAGKSEKNVQSAEREEESTVGETARKISSGFGLWALLTASIALFFATWLAVELSFTASLLTGAILGLVIWGLFYLTMMIVEASALSSLVGGLMRIAFGGLRMTYNAVTGIFGKSDERRLEDAAARVTGAIKEELIDDPDKVKKQIQQWVQQLKPKPMNPERIRDEVIKLLDDTEIRAITRPNSQFDEETVLHFEREGAMDKEKIQSISRGVRGAFSKIREEAKAEKDTATKVIDAALRVAGMPTDEATQYRQRIEEYLRATGREELSPEGIKRDLETFFKDPRQGTRELGDRLAKVDRTTVTALLAKQEDMTPEQAERYVNRVYGVIDRVRGTKTGDGGEGMREEAMTEVDSVQKRVQNKLRNYFNSMQVRELEYDNLADDFYRMFHGDMKGGASHLADRLKSLSRDDIATIVSSRSDMSKEDADRLVSRIENARDTVVERYHRTIDMAKQKAEAVRQETMHQLEETRKTAATAAWWVLASAIVSGIAAVIGGMLATGNGLS